MEAQIMAKEIETYIEVRETTQQIERKMAVGIRDELNRIFPASMSQIEREIKKIIYDGIIRQPEYSAIRANELRIELGLHDGIARLLAIIDTWLTGISVRFKPFRTSSKGLTGGIVVEAVASDYMDVLSMSEAILVTEKMEQLPWLQWLLLEGSSVIIGDYRVVFGAGMGRTGGGHMVKGGSWGIPSQYAGNSNNNFITRALLSIQPELETTITRIIESKI
jgi:hypothetical protein